MASAVAEYLGHADPGFTLRVYAHLFPSSEHRARAAIDRLFCTGSDRQNTATTADSAGLCRPRDGPKASTSQETAGQRPPRLYVVVLIRGECPPEWWI